MLFDVVVGQQERWATVAVIGEMDLATSPRVRTAVQQVLATGARSLVLDLGAVDFIDSTGLGVVLGAVRRVRAADGEIQLVVRQPATLRTFQLTGLDQVLPIVSSIDDALAATVPGSTDG